MINRGRLIRGLAIFALLAFPVASHALINPDFTPIHLVKQSETIFTAAIKSKDIGDKVELELSTAIKGNAPAKLVIDLTGAPKERADTARKLLIASAEHPVLLFLTPSAEAGYLHVNGVWLKLAGKNGEWRLETVDQKMLSTWDGGTDMLARCAQYIVEEPVDAAVPAAAPISWREIKKIGDVGGPARDIAAVDLAGDGYCCLFVASDKGDRLLRPGKRNSFEDITAKIKLASASRFAVWGDFDGDAGVSLASYDGKNLTIWKQAGDGAFSATAPRGNFELPKDCVGMESIAFGTGKAAGLLFSTASGRLVLLKASAKNVYEAATLPSPAAMPADYGKSQACLVADFDGDSLIDIIQPFEKGGLIYLGNKDGSFAAPKPCRVASGVGGGKAALGDFDGDGLPDVLIAGAEGVKIFQNRGHGIFEESISHSGEPSYKNQPHASWCGVCDFNNDSRQDIFIAYDDQPMMLFFNRGFRTFGQIPRRQMALDDIPDFARGQQMALFADVKSGGAQDLFVVTRTGEIWCAHSNLAGDDSVLSIRVRMPADAPTTAPVNVALWKEKRCLGTVIARRGAAPAFLGIDNPGRYTLKWQFPGGGQMSKDITVEDGAKNVVLEKDK